MSYALRNGISFCNVGGRLLFLDIAADRYFCLGECANRAFAKLVAGERLTNDEEESLAAMVRQKLLVAKGGHGAPTACVPPPHCRFSALDQAAGHSPRLSSVVAAAAALAASRVALKRAGLARTVSRFDQRRQLREELRPNSGERLIDVAAAFHRAALLFSPLDQCLPRAIAIANRLIAHGIAPTLVIGVKLKPFAAHSWVQVGPGLINDQIDNIRNFTPILVV